MKSEPISAVQDKGNRFKAKETAQNPKSSKQGGARDHKPTDGKKCWSCGLNFPHSQGRSCPAKGRKCNSCGKIGHFAKFCKERKLNLVNNPGKEEVVTESDDSEGFLLTHQENWATDRERPYTEIYVLGEAIRVLVDSGADEKIIDERTYEQVLKRPNLEQCQMKLFVFNSDKQLEVLGQFRAQVRIGRNEESVCFKVVKGNPGCLLSYGTARRFGLFQTKAFSEIRYGRVAAVNDRYASLMERFNKVFNDKIGKLENFQVEIAMDPNVTPVQVPYRRQPYHLVKAIDKELDKLLSNDIIEVLEDPPSSWVSALMAVPSLRNLEKCDLC